MRKKLIILGFALAAATASTLTPASADPTINSFCPAGTRRIDCVAGSTPSFICCPDYAMCYC